MGHYDYDRSGPSKAEVRLRQQAYNAKQAKLTRDEITDTEIRSYLVELHECSDDGRYTTCMDRHAKDALYEEEAFDIAEQLVEQDIYEEVYDVLPLTDRGSQLKQMCYDEGWVHRQVGHELTDEGIEVMFDGDIKRTNDPTWDEELARKWHKHD